MHKASTRQLLASLALLVIMAAVALFFASGPGMFSYMGERMEYASSPSAPRAYALGMRHFDSSNADTYNLAHAAHFLEEALERDESYPLANQQLARIRFIQGDFKKAISHINREIEISGDQSPSVYYIRGLIRGYAGSYLDAESDFSRYIKLNPEIWAAYNDRAWVLMKAGLHKEALGSVLQGLEKFPDNAWLLNSFAIALYETGDAESARSVAVRAQAAVSKLTPQDWSNANPGNDPRVAATGLETFKSAAGGNLEKIIAGLHPDAIDLIR